MLYHGDTGGPDFGSSWKGRLNYWKRDSWLDLINGIRLMKSKKCWFKDNYSTSPFLANCKCVPPLCFGGQAIRILVSYQRNTRRGIPGHKNGREYHATFSFRRNGLFWLHGCCGFTVTVPRPGRYLGSLILGPYTCRWLSVGIKKFSWGLALHALVVGDRGGGGLHGCCGCTVTVPRPGRYLGSLILGPYTCRWLSVGIKKFSWGLALHALVVGDRGGGGLHGCCGCTVTVPRPGRYLGSLILGPCFCRWLSIGIKKFPWRLALHALVVGDRGGVFCAEVTPAYPNIKTTAIHTNINRFIFLLLLLLFFDYWP